jgi:FimV N-terminal domain
MRRKRLAFALASLMGSSPTAFALGLGGIEVRSTLDQPLNAEIELFSAHPEDVQDMRVTLGSAEAFHHAGIERSFLLSQLRFKVVERAGDRPHIQITSTQPIQEPFLDFLIEVNWPKGRLLREYTALLDPPVYMKGKWSSGVAYAVAAAPRPAAAAKPVPAPEVEYPATAKTLRPVTRLEDVPSTAQESSAADTYGPVQGGEVLWNIANKLRPDRSVSIDQMMLALLNSNPGAFVNNNINHLKAGKALRIPDREDINALDRQAASQEVLKHHALWQEYRQKLAVSDSVPLAGQQARAPESAQGVSASGGELRGDQLTLITPESNDRPQSEVFSPVSAAADASLTEESASLRKALTLAEESNAVERAQNEELRTRVEELQGQVNSMEHMITLKDDELATLQKRAEFQGEAASAVQLQVPAASSTAAPGALETRLNSTGTEADKHPRPLLLGGLLGMVVGLAGLAWLLVRRSRLQPGSEGEQAFEMAQEKATATLPGTLAQEEQGATPEITAVAAHYAQDKVQKVQEASSGADLQPDDPQADALSEVELYMAYGRYEQAEEALRRALEAHPTAHALRAKLLEVYFVTKKSKAFEMESERLYAALEGQADPTWQQVAIMGQKLCPDNPLFKNALEAVVAPTHSEVKAPTQALSFEDFSTVILKGKSREEGVDDDMGAVTWDCTLEKTEAVDVSEHVSAGKPPVSYAPSFPKTESGEQSRGEYSFGVLPGDVQREPKAEAPEERETAPQHGAEGLEWPGRSQPPSSDDQNQDHALFPELDEVGTKLSLARAYIDMGDAEGAQSIIEEVLKEGNEQQKQEAQVLTRQIA